MTKVGFYEYFSDPEKEELLRKQRKQRKQLLLLSLFAFITAFSGTVWRFSFPDSKAVFYSCVVICIFIVFLMVFKYDPNISNCLEMKKNDVELRKKIILENNYKYSVICNENGYLIEYLCSDFISYPDGTVSDKDDNVNVWNSEKKHYFYSKIIDLKTDRTMTVEDIRNKSLYLNSDYNKE